ncbi:hypothetical protein CS0771_06610 [Catellatospora sp. IY07-71]|uniref:MmpS family transport accessory protein n=1 Tax=Catellatospora sp. IY07-71 TaxID=2728827 RepID=UPI001BB3577E|nr:MmpS family transport accessory protein [Catellatospora sp. IY07-71]BCJ71117.1 hypothetical protein CS0771_06610 [Catellatospora sp. IY07-71]
MSYPPPQPDPYQSPPPYGVPAYQHPIQPPKKSKAGLIVGIILGVVLVLCVGCGAFGYFVLDWTGDKVQEIEDSLPSMGVVTGDGTGSHTVRYTVEGTGQTVITYSLGTGGTESETVTLPWSKDLTVASDSFAASVIALGGSAKLDGCSITIDGKEQKRSSATGTTAICTTVFVGG